MSHPIFMDLNPICCYVSPKIVIFHEPLMNHLFSIGTCKSKWNICHCDFSGMPQTLNMHHSSHFNVLFPVKINKMWNFCLKLWFFLELLIAQTQNLWHWIWHMSNPTYVLLKPFQCIFPSQNQQNVKFFVWNCNFLGTTYHRDSKPVVLDLACLKP